MNRLSLVMAIFFFAALDRPLQIAQADGHAEISRPAPGDTVSGVVTILGSASSPSFDHFELSFGYDPNPTDTWFPIGDQVSTQVSFGRLGLWDTNRITDGTYALRLVVVLDDGSTLEDVVDGIEVRRAGTDRSAPASGTPAVPEPTALGGSIAGPTRPTPDAAEMIEPVSAGSAARGRAINVTGVILTGAGAAVLGLLGLGAYTEIRQELRRRWGSTRSRRITARSDPDDDEGGGA